jgi:hypothetical protein
MKYSLGAVLALACSAPAQSREHAEASFTLRLPAAPTVVFPLFGPIRESEWSLHWSPTMLYPAERSQKAGAVFTTREHDQDVGSVASVSGSPTALRATLRWGDTITYPIRSDAPDDIAFRLRELTEH